MNQADPKHKGTGLRPVVESLRSNPLAKKIVPKDLWHYLDEPILPSAWYPERHFGVLAEALASTIEPGTVGGNVWAFLGRTAAARDLGDSQEDAPPSLRSSSSGVYRQFLRDQDPEAFFKRAAKIWQQYHDTGDVRIFQRPGRLATVVFRLEGHRFPVPGLEDLQIAYFAEFARLAGVRMRAHTRRGWNPKTSSYEWEFEIEEGSGVREAVQSLPEA